MDHGIYKLSDVSSLTGNSMSALWHYRYGHLNVNALLQAF